MLEKVYSRRKKQELFNILYKPEPSHYERLYLVGFLKHVGYSKNDIANIIRELNKWLDYRPRTTYYYICSIFKSGGTETSKSESLTQTSNAVSVACLPLSSLPDLPPIDDYLKWRRRQKYVV